MSGTTNNRTTASSRWQLAIAMLRLASAQRLTRPLPRGARLIGLVNEINLVVLSHLNSQTARESVSPGPLRSDDRRLIGRRGLIDPPVRFERLMLLKQSLCVGLPDSNIICQHQPLSGGVISLLHGCDPAIERRACFKRGDWSEVAACQQEQAEENGISPGQPLVSINKAETFVCMGARPAGDLPSQLGASSASPALVMPPPIAKE